MVFIPTCGESNETLLPLVQMLSEEGIPTLVCINNLPVAESQSLAQRVNRKMVAAWQWDVRIPFNIYQAWNVGLRMARFHEHSSVAILNDDIEIGRGSVAAVDAALNSHPNIGCVGWNYRAEPREMDPVHHGPLGYVSGSFRKGGIGGFAFAIKVDTPEIDTQFQWWGGDDDLFNTIERRMARRLAILHDAGVRHHTSRSAHARPESMAGVAADRAYMLEKWGESW